MSLDLTELTRLLAAARKRPPMDYWQRRAQAISWAYGQVALSYANPDDDDLWIIRYASAVAHDTRHPTPE